MRAARAEACRLTSSIKANRQQCRGAKPGPPSSPLRGGACR